MDVISNLYQFLTSTQFMPHGHCYLWMPSLVALHVASDGLIALSYMLIPITLTYLIYKRKDIPFSWIVLCFALFIISCGTTHIMEIWTLWHANYWISGVIKAFTGIISFITAILLIYLIPMALKLPTPSAFEKINTSLREEINAGKAKAIEIEKTNQKLLFTIDSAETAYAQLNEKNQLLEQASRLKDELLSNMSHELRTPLNAIMGYNQLLQFGYGGPITGEQHEYLNEIAQNSDNLLILVNNILDLSKNETRSLELKSKMVVIKDLVDELTMNFQPIIKSKKIKFETNLDPNLKSVYLDPTRLRQIIFNYLSNAFKFTPSHGSVTLSIANANDNNFFIITVKDTGIGISPADIKTLFVEFHQLDQSSKKKYPGAGIGLALTKRIAEAYNGEVGVESALGKGSTFYAILPKSFEKKDRKTQPEYSN